MLKKIFQTEGKFTSVMSMVADLVFLSALWVLCCIPVITIPTATAALYYSVTKTLRRGHGYPVQEFLSFFKENWKQGLGLGLVYTVAALLVAYNYYAVGSMKAAGQLYGIYRLESLGICIILLFISVYLFPVFSRFQYTIFQHIKVAFLMSVRHFLSTVLLSTGSLVVIFSVAKYPVLAFVLPAAWVYVVSLRMERIFRRYMKEPGEGEEVPWYWE